MIKFCPDLISYKSVKSASRFRDWDTSVFPVMSACIKDKCSAYKIGRCMKYHTVIEKKKKKRRM